MASNLNEILRERYPKIFAKECEISTGTGWFNILDTVCGCVQSHIDWSQKHYNDVIRYNAAADALAAGDDSLLLDLYDGMNQVWIQARREDMLSGQRREVPKPCEQVVAAQIKEKFGTLRFYVGGGDDHTKGAIQMAEAMSAVTCEECGAPGVLSGRGYLRTLCDRHQRKKDNE